MSGFCAITRPGISIQSNTDSRRNTFFIFDFLILSKQKGFLDVSVNETQ
jgi:hypothetical protein